LRILIVSGAYPPMKCGVGDYTAHLVSHLENIPDVIPGVLTSTAAVVTRNPPKNFFPVIERWNLRAVTNVMEVIKKFLPDVIHIQYPASYGRVLLPNLFPVFFRAINIPVVQTWHEHPIYTQLLNSLVGDTIIVVEPSFPHNYRVPYRFAVRNKKCIYIPIGANIPRAVPSQRERDDIKKQYNVENGRLIVYFGFAQPAKGVDLLFAAADPDCDRIVLICDLDNKDAYHRSILAHVNSSLWRGKSFVTGYLPSAEVAALLATADAAVYPFMAGTTPRNGSVLAARLQGTFVVTTHIERRGYDNAEHTAYVAPGDVIAIKNAIDMWSGTRFEGQPIVASWDEIARLHKNLYENLT
jgi:glycosyltransferase involved in cell wall biosynthesis